LAQITYYYIFDENDQDENDQTDWIDRHQENRQDNLTIA